MDYCQMVRPARAVVATVDLVESMGDHGSIVHRKRIAIQR